MQRVGETSQIAHNVRSSSDAVWIEALSSAGLADQITNEAAVHNIALYSLNS